MNDTEEEIESSSRMKEIKGATGQCILIGDMCFFASATLNAHLNFLETWNTQCSDLNEISIKTWTAVGYSLRVLFTVVFFIQKIKNLSNFISRKDIFPQIGAFCSPIMSTLLISVIVYDFKSCQQISDIFSISSAKNLLSGYSIVVIIIIACFVAGNIISFATKRNHRNKVFIIFQGISVITIGIGCFIGVIAGFEMIKKQRISLFSAFDLYSFLISMLVLVFSLVYRFWNLRIFHASPVSSL